MKIDSATWSRVAELFDAVVDLPPEARRRFLDASTPPDEVRRLLDRLLAAHDTPDPLLLDRPVDDIVLGLLGEQAASAQPIPENLSGRCFGNWRAMKELGRGGMSVVLGGERADGQFEKQVAIKLLPPGPASAARRRHLQSEIRLLARLEHPGIARLLDGGLTDDDMPFLVMEYVDGMPITWHCERRGLNLQRRVELFLQAARAVAYSHGRLVVHCDIKPSNVLVSREGEVRLVDFGIASMLSHPRREDAAVIPHCSPAYAAPEQLRGETPSVPQDIFGLGALLYELLTSRRIRDMHQATGMLFGRAAPDDIRPPSEGLHGIAGERARSRQLKGDLDAICMKALCGDPAERYPGVDALIRDLENWLSHRPVAARRDQWTYRVGKWFRRHRWTAVAAGLASLSLLFGSGLALWQAREATAAADLARMEQARAAAALVETEQALQRSEALHEFLLDLFRAAEPDRPRDQLPDTEELVALGARRALEEQAIPPGERVGMLMSISEVYLARNRLEEAAPLLEAAVSLGRDQPEARPADLARALRLQAVADIMRRRLDDAWERLVEAESVAESMAESMAEAHPRAWSAFADARATRAWVAHMRGEQAQALDLLEPLREALDDKRVERRTRYRILNHLAAAYVSQGRHEEAAPVRAEVTDLLREMAGEESRSYAINLSNLAVLDLRLGRFDAAEAGLHRAIELYGRIFDQPTELRAAARGNLANLLLYTGRYGQALAEIEAAAREWAAAQGREMGDYEFHFHTRGMMLARMRQWAEAEVMLSRAKNLFAAQDAPPAGGIRLNDALLARVLCRQGRVDEGRELLIGLEETDRDNPTRWAEIQESRATCLYLAGDGAQALQVIGEAVETVDYPGYALQRADRKTLQARILVLLGRDAEAVRRLDRAERLLLELGREDHPRLAGIESLRRELALTR
jgi:serine/threonine-protein kinase